LATFLDGAFEPGKMRFIGNVAYVSWAAKHSESKTTNNFVERKIERRRHDACVQRDCNANGVVRTGGCDTQVKRVPFG
jgi:hypothetical protein